jgi:hypothetical protein
VFPSFPLIDFDEDAQSELSFCAFVVFPFLCVVYVVIRYQLDGFVISSVQSINPSSDDGFDLSQICEFVLEHLGFFIMEHLGFGSYVLFCIGFQSGRIYDREHRCNLVVHTCVVRVVGIFSSYQIARCTTALLSQPSLV